MRLVRATYSERNRYLLWYLTEEPFNVSDLWSELAQTWDGWEGALEAVGSSPEELGSLANADEMEKLWDICHKVSDWMNAHRVEKGEAAISLMREYPTEAPTWAHLMLSRKQLLPPSTWLVHWTNAPDPIVKSGFVSGVDDVARLGLTTYLHKSGSGYNFAYLAEDAGDNLDKKYGSSCVMFQSSGVLVHHFGDEEYQVIFWGPSITTRPFKIEQDQDDKWAVYDRRGRVAVRKDLPTACFSWVAKTGFRG